MSEAAAVDERDARIEKELVYNETNSKRNY